MDKQIEELVVALTADVSGLETGFTKAQGIVTKFGVAVTNFGSLLTNAVSIPLLAAGGAIIAYGRNFETAMNNVKGVTNATTEEMDRLTQKAKEVGAATAKTSTEVAQGMAELSKAGLNVDQVLSSIEAVTSLATISGQSMEEAAATATAVLYQFGKSADTYVTKTIDGVEVKISSLSDAINVLATAAASSNADVTDIAEAMKFTGSVASNLGVEFNEVAAALAYVSNRGLNAGLAGRGLRQALISLSAPTSGAREAMEKMGFSAYDSDGKFKSLSTIVTELATKLNGLTDEEKNAALKAIFTTNAITPMLSLIQSVGDTTDDTNLSFQDFIVLMDESYGAAERMENALLTGLSGAMTILQSSIETAAQNIYDYVEVIAEPAVRKLIDALNWFNYLPAGLDDFKEAFTSFGGILDYCNESVEALFDTVGSMAGLTKNFNSKLTETYNTITGINDKQKRLSDIEQEIVNAQAEGNDSAVEKLRLEQTILKCAQESSLYKKLENAAQTSLNKLTEQRSKIMETDVSDSYTAAQKAKELADINSQINETQEKINQNKQLGAEADAEALTNTRNLTALTENFKLLTKGNIVALLGIAIAIGPIIKIVGGVITKFGLLSDNIRDMFQVTSNGTKNAEKNATTMQNNIQQIVPLLTRIADVIAPITEGIENTTKKTGFFTDTINNLSGAVSTKLSSSWTKTQGVLNSGIDNAEGKFKNFINVMLNTDGTYNWVYKLNTALGTLASPFKTVQNAAQDLWTKFTDSKPISFLTNSFKSLSDGIKKSGGPIYALQDLRDSAKMVIGGGLSLLRDSIESNGGVINSLKNLQMNVKLVVGGGLSLLKDKAIDVGTSLTNKLRVGLTNATTGAANLLKSGVAKLPSIFSSIASATGSALQKSLSAVGDGFAKIGKGILSIGGNVIKGAVSSIMNLALAATGATTGVGAFLAILNSNKQFNVTQLLENSKTAVNNFITNLLTTMTTLTEKLPAVITEFTNSFATIIPQILDIINTALPTLVSTAIEIFKLVTDALVDNLPLIVSTITTIFGTFISVITQLFPVIIEAGGRILVALAQGLADAIPDLIPVLINGITTVINSLVKVLPDIIKAGLLIIKALGKALIDNMPLIVKSVISILNNIVKTLVDNLPLILQAGLELIMGLAQALIDNLPTIIDAVINLIITIFNTLIDNLPILIDAMITLMTTLMQAMIDNLPLIIDATLQLLDALITALIDNLPLLVEAAIKLVVALAGGLLQALPQLLVAVLQLVVGILALLASKIPEFIVMGIQLVGNLAVGFIKSIPDLLVKAGELTVKLIKGIGEGLSGIGDIGVNLVKGLWNGIKSMKDWVIDKIKGFGSDITDGLKKFFGIKSPSRVMRDQIGKYLAQGIGVGFDQQLTNVSKTMTKGLQGVLNDLNTMADVELNANASLGTSLTPYNNNQVTDSDNNQGTTTQNNKSVNITNNNTFNTSTSTNKIKNVLTNQAIEDTIRWEMS